MTFLNAFKGGIGNLFGGVGAKPAPTQVEGGLGLPSGYQSSGGIKDLEVGDFLTGSNGTSTNPTNLKNGRWQELGAYIVPNQQAFRWGFADVRNYSQSWGVVYVAMQNAAGTARQGKLRLVWKDASRKTVEVMREFNTNRLGGSATVRDQQVLLPEVPTGPLKTGRNFAVQDEFLGLDFDPTTDNSDIASTVGTVRISSTQYFMF